MAPPSMESGAASRALNLIIGLGRLPEGATVTELARIVGCSVPTASRQMALLQRYGFARVDPNSRLYFLGLRVFELSRLMGYEHTLRRAAASVLDSLAKQTGCLVSLDLLENVEVVTIDTRESMESVQVHLPIGGRSPAHVTASGRAIIAHMEKKLTHRLISQLKNEHELGFADAELTAKFEGIREAGYATTDGENDHLIRAVAVPVFSAEGQITAALSIAAPVFTKSMDELLKFLPELRSGSDSIASNER